MLTARRTSFLRVWKISTNELIFLLHTYTMHRNNQTNSLVPGSEGSEQLVTKPRLHSASWLTQVKCRGYACKSFKQVQ
jgi:hypothetical protein